MSRIAHKLLTIEIDPLNDVDDNDTRIYAINYNILTISDGIAGLKF
jgi:heterodisulfide reductase subunit A-like polyferredoxin